ncbi:MAG: YceI family protein [Phycisphaerae bacterium]
MYRIMTSSCQLVTLGVVCVFCAVGKAGGEEQQKPQYERLSADSVHSSVLFRVTHLGVGPFWGRFAAINGDVDVAVDGSGIALSLEVPIESVDTGNEKLDQHLQSPDFFDAAKHPKATFVSKSAKKKSGGVYGVSGELTIRGVTRKVEVDVRVTGPSDTPRGRRCGIETEFVLKRSDYGVSYGVGGGMLGDDTRLIVGIEAVAPEGEED